MGSQVSLAGSGRVEFVLGQTSISRCEIQLWPAIIATVLPVVVVALVGAPHLAVLNALAPALLP